MSGVSDAVFQPGYHLLLGYAATVGRGHSLFLVVAGIEEEAAGHQRLGCPFGGVSGLYFVILLIAHKADSLLQIGSDLRPHLVGSSTGRVSLLRSAEYQGYAAKQFGQFVVLEGTHETGFALTLAEESGIGHVVGSLHQVKTLQAGIGGIDALIVNIPAEVKL